MTDRIEVAIVGAGPFGLSIAAHLAGAGVPHRVFGRVMANWREKMPPGMLLKSAPWASCLYDPDNAYTLKRYSAEAGVAYDDMLTPLPVETFVAYGEAFQRRCAPAVDGRLVRLLTREGPGFRLAFDEGADVIAARVVLAVGVHPFRQIPELFAGMPAEKLSHSSDHGPVAPFAGRRVAIIGGGASASGLAALIAEAGGDVTLVARDETLPFSHGPKPMTLQRRLTQPLRSLLFPESGIGRGWKHWIFAEAPWTFHALPDDLRRRIGETTLGPSGHPEMRRRVLGRLPVWLGQTPTSAKLRGEAVELDFVGRSGTRRQLQVDHVIAATGYRIDLRKLDFLDPALVAEIATSRTDPVLDADYQTSVPGLHVAGPAAAHSFGPVIRFVFGAIHPARRIAKLAASRGRAIALPRPAVASYGPAE